MRKLIMLHCSRCNTLINIEKGENCKCNTSGDKKVSTEFKPFFSDETGTMITSQRQMDRVYKKHGLRPLGDLPNLKKYQHIQSHREDYIQEKYRKDGIDYKPGSNTRFSEWRKELVPMKEYQREKALGR